MLVNHILKGSRGYGQGKFVYSMREFFEMMNCSVSDSNGGTPISTCVKIHRTVYPKKKSSICMSDS